MTETTESETPTTEAPPTPRGTTLYLSGPMTGIKHFNRPAFTDAAGELRAWGYTVISPHELDADAGIAPSAEWTPSMRRDAVARNVVAVTSQADGVAVLPGWHESLGARAEVALANSIPLRIQTIHEWIDEARKAVS